MLYDKASPGSELKYLLLFGDASFDFKAAGVDNNTDAFMGLFSNMMGMMNSMMQQQQMLLLLQ